MKFEILEQILSAISGGRGVHNNYLFPKRDLFVLGGVRLKIECLYLFAPSDPKERIAALDCVIKKSEGSVLL